MRIYDLGNIEIQVWPKDHQPVHCHVLFDGCEIRVFLPDYSVEVVSSKVPKASDIREAIKIVKHLRRQIGQQWRKFHGN
jgi:hypothetical protein